MIFVTEGWTSWASWAACTVSCGQGFRVRFRSCRTRDNRCIGQNIDQENCNLPACIGGNARERYKL